MKLMSVLVKINNAIFYIAFFVLLVFVSIAAMSGQVGNAIIIAAFGMFILALFGGYWAIINCILDEQKKTNVLLSKILEK